MRSAAGMAPLATALAASPRPSAGVLAGSSGSGRAEPGRLEAARVEGREVAADRDVAASRRPRCRTARLASALTVPEPEGEPGDVVLGEERDRVRERAEFGRRSGGMLSMRSTSPSCSAPL